MNNRIINKNFYLKGEEYDKSCFDLCKVELFDLKRDNVDFNDVSWSIESFLEKFTEDIRLKKYLKNLKKRNQEQEARKENEKLVSSLTWLQEYIFQKWKYGLVTKSEDKLFEKLENLINKFYNYHQKTECEKRKLIEKKTKLIEKSLRILELDNENFIEFISYKKSGGFVREILEIGLNQTDAA